MADGTRGGWPGDGAADKRHVLDVRRAICALVARIGDPAIARRIEAELNDAWLRLQFARVAGDPVLAQAERRACATLLLEARRRARRDLPPG